MAASRITRSSSPLSRRPASSLDLGVGVLPGVGPSAVKLLERLDIRTIGELLWHLPARHLDYTRVQPLRSLRIDAEQSTEAIVGTISERRTARGQMLTEIELLDPADSSPTNVRATWFGRQFIKERFRPGQLIRLSGKVTHYGRWLQLQKPNVESADAERVHTGRMVPVYRLTEGLKEGHLRRWLHTAVEGDSTRGSVLGELPEPLPAAIRERRGLLGVAAAMREVHFPSSEAQLIEGRRRLAFDELLTLQLGLAQRRARWQRDARAPELRAPDASIATWIAALPFTLTAAQQRAFDEIRRDIARHIPMSRLLEGDVGSGKTVVAALAARIAVSAGSQVALMAPTELLAEQHFRSLTALFAGGPSVELLTASVGAAGRRDVLGRLAAGSLDVVVGTHALVVDAVTFHRLGLIVVDEQHRFGVRQRTTLREKGVDPHLLLTTATPIPRTLTQTIYRDLDLSVIDELPAGRQEIRTEVRPPEALAKVWPWVREHVHEGEQAFVVCPRIDPGEGGDDDAPSAVAIDREMRAGPLAGLRIGLLHGRMPAKDRDDVMRRFAGGEVDVLVATTVVEVGIDVPNATMMIVLGAERFGLAQLHQLRGRVGRGERKAFCVLVSQDAAESARLGAMTERRTGPDGVAHPLDGFDLAKRDLEIRGAGEFLGDEQSGASELRIVDLSDVDPRLAAETAAEADAILAADPTLERPEHADLAVAVEALWRRYALA